MMDWTKSFNLVGLNLRTIFAEQGHIRKLLTESFDVTLFCEDGPQIEAHKIK